MAVNRELLEETLDIIRQSLQADGGDVELIDVNDEGVVTLDNSGMVPDETFAAALAIIEDRVR